MHHHFLRYFHIQLLQYICCVVQNKNNSLIVKCLSASRSSYANVHFYHLYMYIQHVYMFRTEVWGQYDFVWNKLIFSFSKDGFNWLKCFLQQEISFSSSVLFIHQGILKTMHHGFHKNIKHHTWFQHNNTKLFLSSKSAY